MPDSVRLLLQEGARSGMLLLAVTCLLVVLLFACLIMTVRLARMGRQLSALTRGVDGQNLEGVMTAHLDVVDATVRRMDGLEQSVAVLQAQMPSRLQRANLLRYDAFDDVGGEQSFSLALLDGMNNGVVISSVYSRMDVRVYAKAIENGRASHPLSDEEARVVRDSSAR